MCSPSEVYSCNYKSSLVWSCSTARACVIPVVPPDASLLCQGRGVRQGRIVREGRPRQGVRQQGVRPQGAHSHVLLPLPVRREGGGGVRAMF